jgi:predicted TIM-barrel fold metal-dependent hydrolase
VWADADEAQTAFPYRGPSPPVDHLQNVASTTALLAQMDEHGVAGALIVQPIHHGFDHSYVLAALRQHPDRFKGMILYEPGTDVDRLEELLRSGHPSFRGVRFNPYLWKQQYLDGGVVTTTTTMCDAAAEAVYKRCGELQLPVGIMCYQGLHLHYSDIVHLVTTYPDTTLILDHLAFVGIRPDPSPPPNNNDDDDNFAKLLALAQYPTVHVKISALFRLGDAYPYEAVRVRRFVPLLNAYSSERLLFGSDFPFCLEQPAQYKVHQLVASWCEESSDRDRHNIMAGTAERLFGPWSAAVMDVKL